MSKRNRVITARLFLWVALLIGIPLFLRMPPWCDLTLYDEAAANLLAGGVHYRDVFDTNLPGFVWLLTTLRFLFGSSLEVVRLVDLGVVAGIVAIADRLAAAGGASRPARASAITAAAWFYPFTSEFNHAQRDVWMLLPALSAVLLRVKGIGHRPRFRSAFLQGILWGVAVWIKPHVLIPALCVWAASLGPTIRTQGCRACLRDAVGLLAGGLLLGGLGLALLIASGSWPAFVEVFTFWNTGYARVMWIEFPERIENHFKYFAPWTYGQLIAWPVALLSIVDGLSKRVLISARIPASLWSKPTDETCRASRLLFSALYLGWTAQALVTQRGFHYVHVPEILLLFFIAATQGYRLGWVMISWCILTGIVIGLGYHPDQTLPAGRVLKSDPNIWCVRHPVMDLKRLAEWPGCFRFDATEAEFTARRQRLAMIRDFFPANNWDELRELAEELRRREVTDGDVIAWDDAPHAVYRLVPTRPGFRFMHVRAMMSLGPEQEETILEELAVALPKARYVVSDLQRVGFEDPTEIADRNAVGSDLLPPSLHARVRARFPFTLPVVFRTREGRGRYLIHAVEAE